MEADFKFSYFLGFVGLFNVMFLLPLFPILNWTGIEKFEWPNQSALVDLIINAILGTVISDYCWAKSVVLLGPLVTTLGITLTIPISMVVDSFYEDKVFTLQHYLGASLILASFITISYKDYTEEKRKKVID